MPFKYSRISLYTCFESTVTCSTFVLKTSRMRPRVRLVSRWISDGRADEMGLPLDALPLADQRRELALERFLGDVLADRADDDAAGVLRAATSSTWARRRLRASRSPILRLTPTRSAYGHVDEEAAGERDLRGDARTLGGDRLLGDLDDQVLAALENVLNRRRLGAADDGGGHRRPPPRRRPRRRRRASPSASSSG